MQQPPNRPMPSAGSGESVVHVGTDGKFTPGTPGTILAHEIAVHAVPNATATELIDGIGMENQIRRDLGLPMRTPDEHRGSRRPLSDLFGRRR